ncbi:MAG: hypothetical protein WEC59_00670, partial [Salibacteraceae bacterium]
MNRRSFISNSALAAGGLMLAGKLSAKVSEQLVTAGKLPDISTHIRHGSFSFKPIKNRFLPSWLKMFNQHRFFQNGISEGQHDFQTVAMHVQGELLNIGFTDNQLLISDKTEIGEFARNEGEVNWSKHGLFSIKLLNNPFKKNMMLHGETVIVVLEGFVKMNDEQFVTNEFLITDEKS